MGGVAIVLLLGSAAIVVLVLGASNQDSAVSWVGAVGSVLAVPALWLAWASYRDDRIDAVDAVALPEVADRIAVAVRSQWLAEAELRRLNDPYALPVRWRAADPGLFAEWDSLVRLASGGGAGWPDRDRGSWASSADELARTGGGPVDLLDRVPTGRLVVLGAPGAGQDRPSCAARAGPAGPAFVGRGSAGTAFAGVLGHDWIVRRLGGIPARARPSWACRRRVRSR
jgi:hypothetical protein